MQKAELEKAARLVAIPTSGLAKELVELRAQVRIAIDVIEAGNVHTGTAMLKVLL